jgi:hypothetical protein
LLVTYFPTRLKFPNSNCAIALRKLWNIFIVSLEAPGRYLRE